MMIAVAVVVTVGPIALGVVLGLALRRRVGRRLSTLASFIAMATLPTAFCVALTIAFPLIGLWDAVTEGLLFSLGLVAVAHTAAPDRRNVGKTLLAALATALLVECGARLFLGQPPAYPIGDGPSFLLSTMLRTAGPDSHTFRLGGIPARLEAATMDAPPDGGTMADRPPSQMVTREVVCSIAYGAAYRGLFRSMVGHEGVLPNGFTPRTDAKRTVLHVGDSMVFAGNVERGERFSEDLERLEPGTQHINAGIPGAAPDDYLVILRAWIASHSIDLAVVYLFAGNDMEGIDAPHPCSGWKSILEYQNGRARLRYPDAPREDRGIGLRWLVVNSPLPYVARLLIVWRSAAAAFLGRALDAAAAQASSTDPSVEYAHLAAILHTAHQELAAKRIPFVVVVLPQGYGIDVPDGPSDSLSRGVKAITEPVGITTLDATPLIREALAHGRQPIESDGSHFNREGHRLIAAWLHRQLPAPSRP